MNCIFYLLSQPGENGLPIHCQGQRFTHQSISIVTSDTKFTYCEARGVFYGYGWTW